MKNFNTGFIMLVLRSYMWLHGCHLTTGGLVGLGVTALRVFISVCMTTALSESVEGEMSKEKISYVTGPASDPVPLALQSPGLPERVRQKRDMMGREKIVK